MSYAERICKAKNEEAAVKAMQAGLTHYATPWDDLPILVAAMQLTAGAMQPVIGEMGCAIVNDLLKGIQTVAVKTDAVRKERGEG